MNDTDGKPIMFAQCPACERPFVAFLRGLVKRPLFPWWANLLPLKRFQRPCFAVICSHCKETVGWEGWVAE